MANGMGIVTTILNTSTLYVVKGFNKKFNPWTMVCLSNAGLHSNHPSRGHRHLCRGTCHHTRAAGHRSGRIHRRRAQRRRCVTADCDRGSHSWIAAELVRSQLAVEPGDMLIVVRTGDAAEQSTRRVDVVVRCSHAAGSVVAVHQTLGIRSLKVSSPHSRHQPGGAVGRQLQLLPDVSRDAVHAVGETVGVGQTRTVTLGTRARRRGARCGGRCCLRAGGS